MENDTIHIRSPGFNRICKFCDKAIGHSFSCHANEDPSGFSYLYAGESAHFDCYVKKIVRAEIENAMGTNF
jgi:hypothetical protein